MVTDKTTIKVLDLIDWLATTEFDRNYETAIRDAQRLAREIRKEIVQDSNRITSLAIK